MTDMDHSHDKRRKFIDTMRRRAKAEESRRTKQRESKLDEWDAELLSFNEELHATWKLARELIVDYGMTREKLVSHATPVKLSRQAQALLFAQSDPSTRLDYLTLVEEHKTQSMGERHGESDPIPEQTGDVPESDRQGQIGDR